MTTPISNLATLIRSMEPELHAGTYAYCVVPHGSDTAGLQPVATIAEREGITLVLPEERASAAGLSILFRAAWISLTVHSDLHAVGLTAAFADALGQADISCNVIAGAFHDHIFVPVERGAQALAALEMLQQGIAIRPAGIPADLGAVTAIFREYVASPTVSLAYQDYETEFADLPGKYAEPDGRILLAWLDGAVVGCAALRRVDGERCELKRVYVRPAARGRRIGRLLVERMIREARKAAYATMCLDVLPEFAAARQLYARLGFVPAPPVSHNPVPGTAFLALDLS